MASLSYADLRYFVEIAQVRNISRAADRLGISQPSLTAAVQRLERRFECDLLIRGKTGVELTRSGHTFAAKARGFLAEWERVEAAVKNQGEEPAGSFTIGCHVSLALRWLPKQLPALLDRWPKLELQIVHDLSRKVNDLVVSHQVDFALVVNPIRHPDLVVLELARDVFTFWGREKKWADTVLFDPDLLQAQGLIQRAEKRGIRFRRKVMSSSMELLARLAAEGAGTAILPTHIAEGVSPALRKAPQDPPQLVDSVCLVYRADAQRSVGARALMGALKTVANVSARHSKPRGPSAS